MATARPTVVCLTPVKNEAWILDRFLRAASLWADLIVVADQRSTDGSRAIVGGHPKAVLVDNDSDRYNEVERQRLLLEAGRRLCPGHRIFIALDADEALTADAVEQPEWKAILQATPGTVLRMQWVNILRDEPRAWIPPAPKVFGFVDDGSEHEGGRIHTPRLPSPAGTAVIDLREIKVLHLQHLDTERTNSKQRWYEVWERLQEPNRRLIQIYRRYHHMDAVDPRYRHPIPDRWLNAYASQGIDLLDISPAAAHYWDAHVMDLVEKHGVEPFRRLDLWSIDWQGRASALGRQLPDALRKDPKSSSERWVFDWLARTQHRASDRRIRWAQRALRVFGW